MNYTDKLHASPKEDLKGVDSSKNTGYFAVKKDAKSKTKDCKQDKTPEVPAKSVNNSDHPVANCKSRALGVKTPASPKPLWAHKFSDEEDEGDESDHEPIIIDPQDPVLADAMK